MTHSKLIKTFAEIQSHVEMEEERLKTFSSSNVVSLLKGIEPEVIRTIGVDNL